MNEKKAKILRRAIKLFNRDEIYAEEAKCLGAIPEKTVRRAMTVIGEPTITKDIATCVEYAVNVWPMKTHKRENRIFGTAYSRMGGMCDKKYLRKLVQDVMSEGA